MDSYRSRIKLRMGWWFTWWVIVVLLFIMQVSSVIDAFRHLDMFDKSYLPIQLFWLIVFGSIAITKFPRIDRLLQKDIKKNPENVYAKVMILERKVKNQDKNNENLREKEDLARRVKEMEDKIGE
jgi:amino acid permease